MQRENVNISGTEAYNLKMQKAHKKDSPEAIRAEVRKWSELFPEYKRVVEDIRCVLHGRDQRGGCEFHSFRPDMKESQQHVA